MKFDFVDKSLKYFAFIMIEYISCIWQNSPFSVTFWITFISLFSISSKIIYFHSLFHQVTYFHLTFWVWQTDPKWPLIAELCLTKFPISIHLWVWLNDYFCLNLGMTFLFNHLSMCNKQWPFIICLLQTNFLSPILILFVTSHHNS